MLQMYKADNLSLHSLTLMPIRESADVHGLMKSVTTASRKGGVAQSV
jgi:hypothetical protein